LRFSIRLNNDEQVKIPARRRGPSDASTVLTKPNGNGEDLERNLCE
jgi:hypothetical protein